MVFEVKLAGAARNRLPSRFWHPLRAVATAVLTPIRFSRATGHWRSAMSTRALSPNGHALPWYTYPAIDFLSQRDLRGKRVLEFGGGQSTLWWAQRASEVLTIEEDEAWYRQLLTQVPGNVDLRHVAADTRTRDISAVKAILDAHKAAPFDVIVVDGHLRREATALAFSHLAPTGALILDNAEGYGFHEEVSTRPCQRVDFFGFAPGVSRRHCTSLVFVGNCFLLDPAIPIASIEPV